MKAYILEGFGFRLAFLSFLLLGVAGPAYAGQSGAPTPSPSQSSGAAAPAVAPGAAAPSAKSATQAGQTAEAGTPAAKGNQEGIKVHGHWTIEVKNPDGTLVTHREFENALQPNGQIVLTGLLSNAFAEGGWYVKLCGTGGGNDCSNTPTFLFTLAQAGNGANSVGCRSPDCYTTLSITSAVGISSTVLLSGSVPSSPLTSTVSIDTAETDVSLCPITATQGYLQPSCLTNPLGDPNPYGPAEGPPFILEFTGKSLTPAISVAPGQSVSVTVQFSFQ